MSVSDTRCQTGRYDLAVLAVFVISKQKQELANYFVVECKYV